MPLPDPPCKQPSPSMTVQWLLANVVCWLKQISGQLPDTPCACPLTDEELRADPVAVTGEMEVTGNVCASDNGPCWETLRGLGEGGEPFESEDQSGAAAPVTNAPAMGSSLVITDLIISAEVAMFLWFTDSVDDAVVLSLYVPAGGTINIVTRGELLLPPDAVLEVESSVAGWFSVQALYKEKIVGI